MLEYAPNATTSFDATRPGSSRNSDASLLQSLRLGTRDAHGALEAQPLVSGLLDPTLSPDRYVQLLQAFAAFYRRLEPRLSAALDHWHSRFPSVYRYRPRLPLLQADLADLGCDFLPEPGGEVPVNVTIETVPGVLYVLEGATQGGRVIGPRLHRALGLSGHWGARYFNLHGQLDSWSHFRDWLSRIEPHLDQNATLSGARATFSGLHAHLDHWQVEQSDR
ncbi:biliverdin-producing heme oxygenase [Marinimicrobium sp. C2-29]|uniref:biliverdin-producing heme oxygenase n=1 Tax=Marinimicrobium sp. C2-29 TaxID=3139825 RepID=UPI00313A3833